MQQFKKFNLENNIPIMRDQTIEFLFHMFDNYKNAKVLEIGTAYGYSSKYLAKHNNIEHIITLENDKARYEVAQQWLKDENKIESSLVSAFDYEPKEKFDCIIIDGPKSHQEVLFEKYSKHLNKNGFIFVDNLNLFQNTNKEMTRNRLRLKAKVEAFKKYISNLTNWDVKIYEIDDGYAIIRRKDETLI